MTRLGGSSDGNRKGLLFAVNDGMMEQDRESLSGKGENVMKRESGKPFTERWYGAVLTASGLILAAQVLAFIAGALFPLTEKSGFLPAFRTYFSDLWLWLLFIPVMLSRPDDRETLRKLRPRGQSKRAAAGAALGIGMIAVCYGTAAAAGDLKPVYAGAPWWQLLLMLFAVTVQAGGEELVFRCFLLERLRRDLPGKWPAVLLNAVLFGAMHLANENVTAAGFAGTAAMGLLLAVLYVRFESPWQVILLHTLWNWLQNVILGLPNSGWVFSCSLLGVTGIPEKATFFYDPRFGLEGGWLLAITAVIVAAAADRIPPGMKK